METCCGEWDQGEERDNSVDAIERYLQIVKHKDA